VRTAALSREDSVLEIGAGVGTLTAALADQAGWVTALEVDQGLLPALQAGSGGLANVRVVVGDALEIDLGALFGGPPDRPRKVVANLPYNIAAPILMRLLDPSLRLSLIVVTIQREVAERVVAAPGSRAYGRLSVAVQYHALPRIASRVPPGAFIPAPAVESAVLEIIPRGSPPVAVPDEKEFFRVVASGFGYRRKMLLNALARGLSVSPKVVEAACGAAGVDPRSRAEDLDLGAFAALARALHPFLAAG
jgi:16S rRNA (adenine1518-N6/adenine1519-N6)-dimethyltransferase